MCTVFINRYQIKYFSACKTTVKGKIDDQLAKPMVYFMNSYRFSQAQTIMISVNTMRNITIQPNRNWWNTIFCGITFYLANLVVLFFVAFLCLHGNRSAATEARTS